MDLASFTGAHSRALKNTSKDIHWAHQQGLDSEKHVRKYYETRSYECLAERVKTPFAEVDLLFKTPLGNLLMVEVKTANQAEFYTYRITTKQKARLLRALQFLTERYGLLVEIHWAFVTKEGEITIIEDISG